MKSDGAAPRSTHEGTRRPGGADDARPSAESAPLKNTLYRKVTRGKRKLTRGRLLLYRVAVVVAWWVVRALWASCRVTHVAGKAAAEQAVRDLKSLIPVYWHQHMLFGARALLDLRDAGLKVGFLVSPRSTAPLPRCSCRRSART